MSDLNKNFEWIDLSIARGDRVLQKGLSGNLGAGDALVLKGCNGSGKTSFIRTLCGLSQPLLGQIFWGKNEVHNCRSEFNSAIAYSGHSLGLKEDLSPLENFCFAQQMRRNSQSHLALFDHLNLLECSNLPVHQLSAGQKQRTSIAIILASNAAIWILDEPFTHLDTDGRSWLTDQFAHHVNEGGRLIMAAHELINIDCKSSVLNLEDPLL